MVPAIELKRHPAAAGPQPKPWVIWMLFGLGWGSLLLFGLSIIPAFHPVVKWSLYMVGWACVACWWGGTAMGANYTTNKKIKPAWTSCFIMACIGTTIGAVPSLAAFIYRSWYVIQSVVVAGLVFFALSAYGDQSTAATEQAGRDSATTGEAGQGPTEEKTAESAASPAAEPKAAATEEETYVTVDSQSYATAGSQ